jgi:hypothetical protein
VKIFQTGKSKKPTDPYLTGITDSDTLGSSETVTMSSISATDTMPSVLASAATTGDQGIHIGGVTVSVQLSRSHSVVQSSSSFRYLDSKLPLLSLFLRPQAFKLLTPIALPSVFNLAHRIDHNYSVSLRRLDSKSPLLSLFPQTTSIPFRLFLLVLKLKVLKLFLPQALL